MKRIKILLVSSLVLALVLLVISATLPSQIRIEKTIEIAAEPGIIYAQLFDPKKWADWDPWKSTVALKLDYSSIKTGKDASATWKDGNGRYREVIVEANPFELVKTEARDIEGQLLRSNSFRLRDLFGKTRLDWIVKIELPFHRRILGVFIGKKYDSMVEAGLEQLKNNSTKVQKEFEVNYQFAVEDYSGTEFYSIVDTSNYSVSLLRILKWHERLLSFCTDKKLKVVSEPIVTWYAFVPEGRCIYEAVIPVEKIGEVAPGIRKGNIEKAKVIVGDYTGHPLKTQSFYQQLDNFMFNQNLTPGGIPWEVYLTDPAEEPDTTKWKLRVYFPVKEATEADQQPGLDFRQKPKLVL